MEWDDGLEEVWDAQIIGDSDFISDSARDDARDAFELGWGADHSDLTPEERQDAREEYYEITGLDADDFNWDAWLEYMGYND